eukprot:3940947-Rhodomonas_salina.3
MSGPGTDQATRSASDWTPNLVGLQMESGTSRRQRASHYGGQICGQSRICICILMHMHLLMEAPIWRCAATNAISDMWPMR